MYSPGCPAAMIKLCFPFVLSRELLNEVSSPVSKVSAEHRDEKITTLIYFSIPNIIRYFPLTSQKSLRALKKLFVNKCLLRSEFIFPMTRDVLS